MPLPFLCVFSIPFYFSGDKEPTGSSLLGQIMGSLELAMLR